MPASVTFVMNKKRDELQKFIKINRYIFTIFRSSAADAQQDGELTLRPQREGTY